MIICIPRCYFLSYHKYNFHFSYLGTGCIFEYDDSHPQPLVDDEDRQSGKLVSTPVDGFCETDLPNFHGSSYSIVKGFTDRMVHHLPILNLRIRMPITDSNNPRNLLQKLQIIKKYVAFLIQCLSYQHYYR